MAKDPNYLGELNVRAVRRACDGTGKRKSLGGDPRDRTYRLCGGTGILVPRDERRERS